MKKLFLLLAALLLAAPAAAQDATDPYSIVKNINGFGILAQFDSDTGRLIAGTNQGLDGNASGPISLLSADRIKGFAFAPDGKFWALVENIQGDTIVAQFDPLTGRLVAGTNQALDGNASGPLAFITADRVDGLSFNKDGGMYVVVKNLQGNSILAQFDTATGRLVAGTNQLLDGNASGPSAPITYDRIGGYAFDPEGAFYSLVSNISGNSVVAQFDLATGRFVSGTNIFLDGNSSGPAAPIAFDRIVGFNFDPTGGMWAVVENLFGNSILAQFDRTTGRLIAGSNQGIDGNSSGPSAPILANRIGGLAFAPATSGAVPEPGTWMLMLLGFGGIGYAMRRRRSKALATA